jgi:hypothetical protein
MKRRIILIGIIILLLVVPLILSIAKEDGIPINPDGRLPTGQASRNAPSAKNIDYNNLESFLETTKFVQDIPGDSTILLRFYNFNSGDREWEKSFILEKGAVQEGNVDNPDLIITIDSKYLPELNSQNFCSTASKAKRNGDLGYSYEISTAKLAWKLKSLNKHKSCFGF